MQQSADEEEVADGLRDAELVAGLSEAELQRLATLARIVEFAPGDYLLTEGRLNDQVYIVSRGIAEVVRDAGARSERIARVGRGSCIGEMSALGGKPVTLSVKALTPIRAIAFDCVALQERLAAVPRLGANLALVLIERLRGQIGRRTARCCVLALPDSGEGSRELAHRLALAVARYGRRMAILDLLDGTGTTPDIRAVSLDAIATDSLVAVSFERELAASTEALLTVRKGPARAISTQVSAVLHFLAAHCDTVLVVAGESEALRLMTEQPEVFVRCVHALHGNARPPPAPRNAGDMLERRALIRDEPPPLRVRGVRRLDEKYGMRVYSAQTNASSMRDLAALARDLAGTRIGIALGSGSARGFAHIGVLERLRELGVPIDALVGSSVGSGIGGLWSFGIEADRVEHLIAGLQTQGMGWALPTRSLLNGNKLERHIRYGADGHGFDDTLWPFGIVAVDLYAAHETLLTDGDLPKCVLASCAIPGIYPPVRIGGRWYVDGSVLHPVPTSFVRSLGVDRVIAVDLGGSPVPASPTRFGPFLLEVLGRSAALMHARITEHSRLGADIVLRPESAGDTPGVRDYMKSRHRWRVLGREAVDAAYDELARLMPPAWKRAPSAAGDISGRGAL